MVLTSIDPFVQEIERQFDRLRSVRSVTATGLACRWTASGGRRGRAAVRPARHRPDSIELTVDRGVLSVSATRDEKYGEDEQLFIRERAMGSFTRRVYLSDHLDTGAIEAAYNHGVLAVRIPVVEKAKPRKIEIQRADSSARRAGARARAQQLSRTDPGCGRTPPGR